MPSESSVRRNAFGRDSMPLDAARTAFAWLVTGPRPVCVDGRHFPGLPRRGVPLDELRDRLLEPGCAPPLRDAVWAYLVQRSRAEGGTWTVACVGVALPALIAIAAELSARFADDPSDIHAAVLCGFLAELASINLSRPWVMARLRWAAYRAGHTFVRDALDTPPPNDEDFHSSEPAPPWGHPDFVLARAVAEGAITGEEAELIGSTRLEEHTLTAAATDRGVKVKTLHMIRSRAEARLLAWLADQAPIDDPSDRTDRDVEIRAVHAATITTAARRIDESAQPDTPEGTHGDQGGQEAAEESSGSRVEKDPEIRSSAVRGTTSHPRARHPLARPATPGGATPEVRRCA